MSTATTASVPPTGSNPHDPRFLPPRFLLQGRVLNVFERPKGTSREGRDYGGDWVVQLLSAEHLRNGETKVIPTDVSVGPDRRDADGFKPGSLVTLPVSVYPFNGSVGIRLASEKPEDRP